ncbi:hypothetical protein MRS44_007042 [Fusarium solani]|uniref:uncharacterized protein n=1 Tax=Fusarium solani TaxID=169388 RepID=UPI0032C414D9|nr:hypothetical protein MRS44_007042 [Fusarium solani]
MKTTSALTIWVLTLLPPTTAYDGDPNATGTYTFDTYNVSGPFPPKETVGGWKATIAVAANVTGDEDHNYPGTSISITAPEDMKLPVINNSRRSNESDWQVCVAFWTPKALDDDAIDDGQDDDGSCSSFLSDDCIEALDREGNIYFWNSTDNNGCGLLPDIPEQCEDYFSDDASTYGFSLGANLSLLDGKPLIAVRPGPTGLGVDEDEAYDNAVRGIWTVIVNWGRRDPTEWRTPDEMPVASLLCLRAINVTEGSVNPNAAKRLRLDGTFALFIALVASSFLLY